MADSNRPQQTTFGVSGSHTWVPNEYVNRLVSELTEAHAKIRELQSEDSGKRSYTNITLEVYLQILLSMAQGNTQTDTAKAVGVSAATVSRAMNCGYAAKFAQRPKYCDNCEACRACIKKIQQEDSEA